MSTKPVLNAFLATLYITIVASIMYHGSHIGADVDGIIVPVAMLSLFVLSAAVMGFIFFYQPLRMYLDGKKTEAVDLFLKTLGTFAGITVVLFFILFALRTHF